MGYGNNLTRHNDVKRNSLFNTSIFDDMFSPFKSLFDEDLATWKTSVTTSGHSMQSTDLGTTIVVDAPGVKASDVHVYVEGNILVVEAVRERDKRDFGGRWAIDGFDASSVSASLEDGLLSMSLLREKPKTKQSRTEVKVVVKT